jgi:hypothetical protein
MMDCQTADCILDYADGHAQSFDAVNAATAMHRLAKVRTTLADRGDERLARLAAFAADCAPKLSAQGLAQVAWGAATSRAGDAGNARQGTLGTRASAIMAAVAAPL